MTRVKASRLRWKPTENMSRAAPQPTIAAVSVSTSWPWSIASHHTSSRVGRRAEQLLGEAHRVAADIGERAAAELGVEPDVRGLTDPEVVGADDLAGIADRPRSNELQKALVLVLEREDEGLPQQRARPAGGLEHGTELGGVAAEHLLAEHGLSRREGLHRPLSVQGVGEGDVDRVDLVRPDDRLVAGDAGLDPLGGRPFRGAAAVAPGDEHGAAAAHLGQSREELATGDVGRAEDAPADRAVGGHRTDVRTAALGQIRR